MALTTRLAAVAAAALLLASCSSGAERDDSGAIVEGGELDVFSLAVGDCFDDPGGLDSSGEQVSSIDAIPCDQSHDNEVYLVFDLPDGDFAGQDAVDTDAGDGCLAGFGAFVGIDYVDSELDIFWLSPTSDGWGDGDREVVCAVYRLDQTKLEGTAAGVAR